MCTLSVSTSGKGVHPRVFEGPLRTQKTWENPVRTGGPAETIAENSNPRLIPHWFRHSFATNRVIECRQDRASWAEAKEQVKEHLDYENQKTIKANIGAAKELVRKTIYEEYGGFELSL